MLTVALIVGLAGCAGQPLQDLQQPSALSAGNLGSADDISGESLKPAVRTADNGVFRATATQAAADSTSAIQTGSATAAVRAIVETSEPGSKAYRIGPFDSLEISVFKVPELSKVLQVSEAGTINYPLVGDVPVAGKTPREVEAQLVKLLGANYLQNPQVSVDVREYNSQRVTVDGSVKKPGVYPIRGGTTLMQMVATVGGLNDVADSTLLVFRRTDGKRTAAKFDIDAIRSGNAKDPELKAGDVIVVNDSVTKKTFENFSKALPLARFFLLF